MHCFTLVYIRSLYTHRIWHLWESWNPSPVDTKGRLRFWGSQKLYVDFLLCGGWHPNPCVVQGSTVHIKHFLLHAESMMVRDFELQTELVSSFLWTTTFVRKNN